MTALFLALVVLFAWYEARRDARLITEGKVIEHAWRWRIRMFGVCIFLMPMLWPIVPMGSDAWTYVRTYALLCVASGALFSCAFRVMLNRRRGKDWRYVAPWSSKVDAAWYRIAWVTEWIRRGARIADFKAFYPTAMTDRVDRGLYPRNAKTREIIHCAGLLMTITELLITAAALVGMWYANK